MPTYITGLEVRMTDGEISRNADNSLSIDINGLKYDIAGTKGTFAEVINQSVTDDVTNYVYLDSNGALQISTSSYPSAAHLRLGRAVASSGVITLLDDRAFLSVNDFDSVHSHSNKAQLDLVTDGDHDVRTDNPHSTDVGNLGSGTLAELNSAISDATLDDSGDTRDPNAHALGGTAHSSDTLANLNAKISDATLDDSSDTRTPSVHAASHIGADEIDGDKLDIDWNPSNYTPAITPAEADDVNDLTAHLYGIDQELADSHTHTNQAQLDLVTDGDHDVRTDNPHSTDVENLGSGTLAELNAAITDATLDDSSDARTPTSHASSHIAGGGDSIKLDDFATPDDNTDLDATLTEHGLLKKLGGGTTNFLRADGSWAAPPGGGGQTNTVAGATGITNTGDNVDAVLAPTYGLDANTICQGNDFRLSDDRTPTSHASSHHLSGSDEISHYNLANIGDNSHDLIDSHIDDQINPHQTGIDNLNAGTLIQLNTLVTDATLDDSSDTRLPSSHAANHRSGGSDEVKLDDLAAPDDNTDLDASTSKHGLLKKLGGGTTNFLRADGSWANPGGAASDHDATHIRAGSDEIDGDKLDIDWNPTNYTPATTPSQVDNVDHLTAHLYGIDQAIASAGGGTFGSEHHEEESLSESSTTSSTYQTKVTMTTSALPSGKYRVGWSAEFSNSKADELTNVRVQVGTTTHALTPGYPYDDDEWIVSSGFCYLDSISGVQTVTLQYSAGGAETAYIRRARLELWRIS